MSTILHISDLHFGCVADARADALLRAVARVGPELLVVSGDLTQRGRRRQYEQAAAFLGRVTQAQLIVPGNHDGAYWNPIRRVLWPLVRYQSLICDNFSPVWTGAGLHVVGANSVRPFTLDWRAFWKNGRLDGAQIAQLEDLFASAPPGACRILVVHHPLVNGRDDRAVDCIRRRKPLLAALRRCGVEIVLSGHLHQPCARLAPGAAGDRPVLCVNAGTAISTRLRNQPNSFNVLRVSPDSVDVTVHRWVEVDGVFASTQTQSFPRTREAVAAAAQAG